MKRISFFLLPLLVLTGLAPIAPFSTSASAVSGAGFTTVDVAVDGAGHCANGNPSVNCNIYNGKQFVWLNGGPSAAKIRPDGDYFFAVLAPGGQPAANDGIAKNLSDDFDAYTNRTFTITNGEVSAYSGTHTLDLPLIRLYPYADTPNPGGVYILAICSLAKGYPVKASACKYDAFKVVNPVTNTPTNTPTNIPTNTPTDTPTGNPTATNTPTSTPTDPPTNTPTSTPTSTATTTATATNTPTGSPTATNTPTSTPTGTATTTVTATSTPTNTPTGSPTATNTPTNTPTSTPTSTPTNTPTPTVTVCVPKIERSDFTKVPVGSSVEGLGVVAPDLNIDALHTAVRLDANMQPSAYGANGPSGQSIPNGGMDPGGFSDIQAHEKKEAHHYVFTFTPGMSVNEFSVHMEDFGDYNPSNATNHSVQMQAFDAHNVVVAQQTLSYTTPAQVNPKSSDKYGDLQVSGDALSATLSQPGNWLWDITGTGIVKVQLDFGVGYDPNSGLDTIRFTRSCP
jgi:hypothetical protein